MLLSLYALILGFILDFLFGDPHQIYHPVQAIGTLIQKTEQMIRTKIEHSSGTEQAPKENAELAGGVILFFIVTVLSTAIPALLLFAAGKWNGYLRLVMETIMCYQLLAARSLQTESMKVKAELDRGDLESARTAISMIVGRDTRSLSEAGIIKATVETVAENASDGVIAPLLFILIGGAPLGFLYKAINTMDSMIGYRNEKYHKFGRFAAKMDDVCNYIPARLTAVVMTLAAFLLGYDYRQAWRIYRRDRRKHASPNSAHPEAVTAGALQIQLAGDAYYFGVLHHKEMIGDAGREVEPDDIKRANRLMYLTAALTLFILGAVKYYACTWW